MGFGLNIVKQLV